MNKITCRVSQLAFIALSKQLTFNLNPILMIDRGSLGGALH